MSTLAGIGVKVVGGADGPSGNATALLAEIAALLEALATGDPGASIDLRSLPLTPGDYDALRTALGEGAVRATVDAIGPTEVRETQYPGVWWVTHFNEAGEIVADLIEVCHVPEILASPEEDITEGLARLRVALGCD